VKHCLRSDGTERAWFSSQGEAEAFGKITPGYEDDIVVFCGRCGWFHLSQESWLPLHPWVTPVEKLRMN